MDQPLDPLFEPKTFRTRYGRRLMILVPYRDRLSQLAEFLPHMTRYFERDKLDRHIDWRITIVEQADDKPFNRGALINAGFRLVENDCDYVCFHDVDYLPVWADYAYTPEAARLIWHGLGRPEHTEIFFGAVVALSNETFRRVNGFSNGYWGWGWEDVDLYWRLRATGTKIDYRDGTFRAIEHVSAGFIKPGDDEALTPVGARNRARWFEQRKDLAGHARLDGVRQAAFRLVERYTTVTLEGIAYDRVGLARVELAPNADLPTD